jgi:antirestriction protein ArdC
MNKKQRKDQYQEVTDLIIEALEKGVRPWAKPWNNGYTDGRIMMPLRHNGVSYKGINILILWSLSMKKSYQSSHWMTYKQAKELGGQIRKGEKAAPVFYAGEMIVKDEKKENEEEIIHYLKSYRVFNVEQIDDLPEQYYFKPEQPEELEEVERLPLVDTFLNHTKAEIRHGGNLAYYSASSDYIQMPPIETFKTNHAYYATTLHELTHWTKSKDRLNRELGCKKRGDKGYALEELVAELGAAFLSVDLGIVPDIEGDHAAYIATWLKALKNDKKVIFHAASMAQRAADYVHKLQPQ